MEAGEVVLLAASTPIALPRGGSLRWAALRMDGKVRACAEGGGGVSVKGVMADRAYGGGGGGETYRCGGGGDEAEAVVEL